jgi:K+-sensing histidine kinase KdpD
MVLDVLGSFKVYITKRNYKITIELEDFEEKYHGMKTDWKYYKLILFNIVQNAIKYNKFGGYLKI